MKKTLLFCFLIFSIQGFSQNIFENYRIHRILKIMSHEEYDSLKIERKLDKLVNKKNTYNPYFLLKKNYARKYNDPLKNLCQYYKDTNYTSSRHVRIGKDTATIKRYIRSNQKFITFLQTNDAEKNEMLHKYNVSLKRILCVHDYLNTLLTIQRKIKIYDVHLKNLCKYHKDSNYISSEYANVDTDSSTIENYMKRNNEILDFLQRNRDERIEINTIYKIDSAGVSCVQDYLNTLLEIKRLKSIERQTGINKAEMADTSDIISIQENVVIASPNDIFQIIKEDHVKNHSNPNQPKTSTFILKSKDKLYVKFTFESNENNIGFKTNQYITEEGNTEINNFCRKLSKATNLKQQHLIYSSIIGEADSRPVPFPPGILFHSVEQFNNINISCIEIDAVTYKPIGKFTLEKQDGDSLKNNAELAAARACYAKSIFEFYSGYEIDTVETIDHSKRKPNKSIDRTTGEYRKVTFILLFSDSSLNSFEDFLVESNQFTITNKRVGKRKLSSGYLNKIPSLLYFRNRKLIE